MTTLENKAIARLLQALAKNSRIDAIKELRAMLGLSLKEAIILLETNYYGQEK